MIHIILYPWKLQYNQYNQNIKKNNQTVKKKQFYIDWEK